VSSQQEISKGEDGQVPKQELEGEQEFHLMQKADSYSDYFI